MDLSHSIDSGIGVNSTKKRIQILSKNNPRIFFTHIFSVIKSLFQEGLQILNSSQTLAIVFVILALFFGISAHRISKTESLKEWEAQHFPSENIVRKTLAGLGFNLLEKTSQQQQLLRSLPLLADSSTSQWITQDRNWIAIFNSELNHSTPLLFQHLTQKKISKNLIWEMTGSGWNGFENLIEKLENMPAVPKFTEQVKIKKKMTSVDPRAIHY